jgi:hypothetical protein
MGIKSYIQGRYVENVWEVQCDRDEKTGEITKKPHIHCDMQYKYETLKRDNGEDFIVDGEIGQNKTYSSWLGLCAGNDKINLSEDEDVSVISKVYRADLHAYMVHTDKVLSEKDVNKGIAEFEYNQLLREYNQTMIEADEELLSYCKVHKLVPADTDYDELRKVVPSKNLKTAACYDGAIGYCDTGITHLNCIQRNIDDALEARIAKLESINANKTIIAAEA